MYELFVIDMSNMIRQIFSIVYIFAGAYDIILLNLALRKNDDTEIINALSHFLKDTLLYTAMSLAVIFILTS